MKLLLYCTKAKPYLADFKGDYQTYSNGKELDELFDKGFNPNDIMNILNGKVVAECDFEVERLQIVYGKGWETKTIKGTENIEKLTCLNRDKLYQYCKGNGYAIHIKNLHIFDKPRNLDFYSSNFDYFKKVEKAPQNMMKVWEDQESPRVLISIRPEGLCKILNRE